MGYKKPTSVSRHYLEVANLPQHGSSYTVIPHKFVINETHKLLSQSGFKVISEEYRANMNAQVAQGIYIIQPSDMNEPSLAYEKEMVMIFAWTNSYDKTTRFQCSIGGHVIEINNNIICGDMMSFARKHTGSADDEIRMQISNQVKNAEMYFKKIVSIKETLKNVFLSRDDQASLIGRLFVRENILEINQLSTIKFNMENPMHNFDNSSNTSPENAWAFYNYVTNGLKTAHPRDWMNVSKKFYDFIMVEILSGIAPKNEIAFENNEPTDEMLDNILPQDDVVINDENLLTTEDHIDEILETIEFEI